MNSRSPKEYLQDILEMILTIERFVAGMDLTALEQDQKTLFAISRAFEITGEAVKSLPENIRNQYSEIPWKAIAGMRDKLIHHYWGIDVPVLWKTIQQDLPPFKQMISKILEDYPE